jgi:hypothetical protein
MTEEVSPFLTMRVAGIFREIYLKLETFRVSDEMVPDPVMHGSGTDMQPAMTATPVTMMRSISSDLIRHARIFSDNNYAGIYLKCHDE